MPQAKREQDEDDGPMTIEDWSKNLTGTKHKRLRAVLRKMRQDLLIKRVSSGVIACLTPRGKVVGHIHIAENPRFEPCVPEPKKAGLITVRQWLELCEQRRPDWDELADDLKLLSSDLVTLPDGPSVFLVAKVVTGKNGGTQVGETVGYIDFLRPRFTFCNVTTDPEQMS